MYLLKKMARLLLWLVGSLVLLLLLIIFLIRLPSVQNFITQKAVDYLEREIKTEVRLDRLYIGFPKSVVFEGFYMEDQKRDTLLDLRYLEVDMKMWALWNQKIKLNVLKVDGLNSNISNIPGEGYNFQYIIDALSSDQSSGTGTSSSGHWSFSLNDIHLSNIRFDYKDVINGLTLKLEMGLFESRLNAFDPGRNRYGAEHIHLSDSKFNIEQSEHRTAQTDGDSLPELDLTLNEIILDQVRGKYVSKPDDMEVSVALGHLAIFPQLIDLKRQGIELDRVEWKNSEVVYVQRTSGSQDSSRNSEADEDISSSSWSVRVNEFEASGNSFRYADHNVPKRSQGLDPAHMRWNDLGFSIRNLLFDFPRIQGDIDELRGREQSGFILDEFSAELQADDERFSMRSGELKTPHTKLRMDVRADYPSIEHVDDRLEQVNFDLALSESLIGFKDMTYIRPELSNQQPFVSNPKGAVRLKSSMNGTLEELRIEQLELKYAADTRLIARGDIKGLPEIEKTYFDLEIPYLMTTRSQIKSLVPPGTLPEEINLPERFTASANIKGNLSDFDIQLDLMSSMGRVYGTARMTIGGDQPTSYNADISLDRFDLGELLGDTSFGRTDLRAELNGVHLEPDKMKAQLDAEVSEIYYRGYAYRSLSIQSAIDQNRLKLSGHLRDTNAVLDLQATVDMTAELTRYRGRMEVEGVQLQAIGWMDYDIRAKGNLSLEGEGIEPDSLRAIVTLNRGLILKEGQGYSLDSLYADVNTMDSISRLELYSDFLRGHVEGNVDPENFLSVFRTHIEHYLDTSSVDSSMIETNGQQFDFEFTLNASPLLTEVVLPKLEHIEPGKISGHYRSEARDMEMNMYLPKLIYDGTLVDSVLLRVQSAPETMDFVLQSRSISNPSIRIENPELSGRVRNRVLDIGLSISRDSSYQNLLLRGELSMEDSTYRFRFDKRGIILDNETWQVSDHHLIAFGAEGIQAENMTITQGNRSVSFLQEGEDAVRIAFERFNLQDISQAIEKDKPLVSGEMNGNLIISYVDEQYFYEADMKIGNLHFMELPFGDLALQLQNRDADRFDLQARLSGAENEASLKGSYDMRAQPAKVNASIDISRLSLKTLQAFTAGQVSRSSGDLSGKIELSGSTVHPRIEGQLRFNDARMQISRLNTTFSLSEERIVFDNDNIRFDEFTILDSLGNRAVFNGEIAMKNFSDPTFRVDARIHNFHLFDKQKEQDALFYGHLILNSELRIRGDLDRPEIQASAHVVEGSDLTLVIPAEDPRLETAGGIDEFIDRDRSRHPIMQVAEVTDTVKSKIRGIDLRANVTVGRTSEVRILLDPSGGNYLKVRGDGDFIVGIDPAGNVSLTGRYAIYEGEYQLLFRNVVKRTFILKEGSSLVWSGDPMGARVDLTAVHTKKAEPLGLVQDQLARGDEINANRFKQALPFEIELNMEEELLSPYIDFNIGLPPDYRGAVEGQVQAKLNQLNQNESEVNKQVFSLLVLGRFVPQDPFSTTSSSGAELAARRSVSKLLNAQLDKLSDKFINTVDLDLRLESYEDYSSGEGVGRTELNIGLQRAFFNDRLRVNVGGNVDLEGERRQRQQAGDLIGDISVEYALTEDGSWRLRAFRKNEYEGIIDGDIIKTGTSLIFSRDYNRFSELFKRSSDQKQ